jgi:hypothetical protein
MPLPAMPQAAIRVAGLCRRAALLTLALVGGCGGGGGSSPPPPPPPPPNASPGGIWIGTDITAGEPVLGLVAETGDLFFSSEGITSGGVYYVGRFITQGNAINADVDAILPPGSIYPDRATSGTGALGGQILERTSITGGVTINTDPATSIAGGRTFSDSLSLTFSSQYNRPSSLATIAGNYGPGSLALTISSDGVLFAQDSNSGCTLNGTVATIDPNYNMYAVTLTTSSCAAEFGTPDGAQLTGLASLDNSQSPEYLIIGAADALSATRSALMITINRM